MSNKIKGKYGEELAAKYLKDNGYKIIETNYRYKRYGEVDIIALDKDTLCFVEVKTRKDNAFGEPLEAITYTKLKKIHLCMMNYLNETNITYKGARIDAISILLDKDMQIIHIKNVEIP